MQSIMFSFDAQIQAGIFLNDLYIFSTLTGVYILENFIDLIKIHRDYMGAHIMKSSCSDYFIFKSGYKNFTSKNMITYQNYTGERLRHLNSGSIKFSKKFLIISCFDYWFKIYN